MTASWRRGLLVPTVLTCLALAALVSLGIWQIERKQWKESLIETLNRRLGAEPVELPAAAAWAQLTPQNSDFMRVKFRADFSNAGDALIYTSGSALRSDIKEPGYFVFAPARLADGSIVVIDRGYVREDKAYQKRTGGEEIIGYVRWPEASSWFIADHDPGAEIWYVRNQLQMAAVKHWGKVAPFYIDQEAPTPADGSPRPAPLTMHLRNEHLQYALTWFGLASAVTVTFLLWLRARLSAA